MTDPGMMMVEHDPEMMMVECKLKKSIIEHESGADLATTFFLSSTPNLEDKLAIDHDNLKDASSVNPENSDPTK